MQAPNPDQPFSKLFEPLNINGMTVKNRIVMTAMHLNYTPQGEVNEELIDFYRERVAGGVGLIVIGGCGIDVVGSGTFMLGAWDDRFIDGLAKFVQAMKKEDPKVMIGAQLYHAGRYARSILTGHQPVSASGFGSRFNPESPRPLELDEIPEYQQRFADGALRVQKAGFDTVEVIASAGYLICQFLSPATNLRQDEYGGPFENRIRFGVETIEKVRQAVGPTYPIFLRIAGSDHIPGGHTNKESADVAVAFEKAGADAINVTGGWHEAAVPQLTMGVPRGTYVYLAHGIKKQVSVPVVACNRINNPHLAEQILLQGKADMVGVARGLIADAAFVEKARTGAHRRIRKCIACNQGCFDHVFLGLEVNCLVNYRAGRETRLKTMTQTDAAKNVVIVGGGPAGCEAARIAARRGHRVTVFEREDRLGGALHLCAAPPGRSEFLELANYHAAALAELDVDVRMRTEADPDAIAALNPDVVAVACGAQPILPPFARDTGMKNVVMAQDVLRGRVQCYGDTVVIGGGAVGCETALYLAHQGRLAPDAAAFLIETGAEDAQRVAELLVEPISNITLLEMLPKIGEDIGKSTRWTMKLDLKRSRVDIRTRTKVLSIEPEGVKVEGDDGTEDFLRCENAVIAVGYRPETALVEALKEKDLNVVLLGDAKSPRRAIDAMEEGFLFGWNL